MDELDEKPLDPELEKVRRKMLRLLGVSIGIMFVGVMAVLVAIVYKLNQPSEAESAASDARVLGPADGGTAPPAAELTAIATNLPAGFRIESIAIEGMRIVLAGQISGQAHVVVYDIAAGGIVAEIGAGAR